MTKIFLLGVGAQKAGTSWLHDYLSGHPACNMGLCKEYHILDQRFIPACRHFRKTAHGWYDVPEDTPFHEKPRHLQFFDSLEDYFDYFGEIAREGDMTQVVGDITPSYSGLPREALALAKSELAARGLHVRVIFLMRDPVERIWSSVRMLRRKQKAEAPDHPFATSEAEHVLENFAKPGSLLRGRYDLTLENLAAVFPPEDIHVGLYEELFSPAEVKRITDFLGIDYVEPDFGKRVNVSRKTSPLPPEVQRTVAAHYRRAYEAAAAHVGRERLAANWPSFELVADTIAAGTATDGAA